MAGSAYYWQDVFASKILELETLLVTIESRLKTPMMRVEKLRIWTWRFLIVTMGASMMDTTQKRDSIDREREREREKRERIAQQDWTFTNHSGLAGKLQNNGERYNLETRNKTHWWIGTPSKRSSWTMPNSVDPNRPLLQGWDWGSHKFGDVHASQSTIFAIHPLFHIIFQALLVFIPFFGDILNFLGVLMPSSRSQALQSRHPTGLSSRLSLGPWTRDWWLKATNGMTDVYGPLMFNKDCANIGRCSPT